MKTVGLTYDLRSWYMKQGYTMEETAEFDKESTIDALAAEISSFGLAVDRIGNIYQLVEQLSSGKRWDLVFNIAECLYGDGRESAIPALLDQYKIPYIFSGPVNLGISLNKYYARLVVEAAGVPVSPGAIIRNIYETDKAGIYSFPVFVKPISEGTGKGITSKSIVYSAADLHKTCESLFDEYKQPVLVEEYLPGREYTVGVLGCGGSAKSIGGMEVICRDGLPYCNEVKENYEDYVTYKPIEGREKEICEALALDVWKAIDGMDGGRVDFREDKNGNICFIEVNPLAGLNPKHSDLPILGRLNGIDYSYIIGEILKSALSRYGLDK